METSPVARDASDNPSNENYNFRGGMDQANHGSADQSRIEVDNQDNSRITHEETFSQSDNNGQGMIK